MATNKHAIIRYRVIDKCLRQVDRAWNWKTLAEACALEIEKVTGKSTTLSERTIKGDLQSMRMDTALGYFAPIDYDRAEKSYYYTNRNFSITEAPLSRSDSDELRNAITLLHQFTGFQHLNGIDNIIQKLELLAYESTADNKKLVHLAQPTTIPGQQWLDQLYEAIKDESSLMMTYKPFDREEFSGVISPYLLKEYDNRWYLYAKFHNKDQLRTYGLERITKLTTTLQKYKPTPEFSPETYFRDLIGVTLEPNKAIQKVCFRAFGKTADYIRTKPLHNSQVELDNMQDTATFQIAVIPNFELESLLLSFGENIEITKPKAMQQRIAKRLSKAHKLYS